MYSNSQSDEDKERQELESIPEKECTYKVDCIFGGPHGENLKFLNELLEMAINHTFMAR